MLLYHYSNIKSWEIYGSKVIYRSLLKGNSKNTSKNTDKVHETKINPSPKIRATGNVRYIPSGKTFEQMHTWIASTTIKHAIAIDFAIILKLFPDNSPLAIPKCPVKIAISIRFTPNTHEGLEIA